MTTTEFPLRRQRKEATRNSLIKSARTLFAEQGYDNTTLEQVAEHAGLHVQTLYRHFANKQELATAGDKEALEAFTQAIRNPARTNDTFTFWRGWVQAAVTRVAKDGGQQYRRLLRERWAPPVVSTSLISIGHAYEDLLTESVARDFGMPVESPAEGVGTPRLVGILLWGVNAHILRLHASREQFDIAAEAVRVIDEVEAHFGHLVQGRR